MRVRWLRKALRNLDDEATYIAAEDTAAARLVVKRVLPHPVELLRADSPAIFLAHGDADQVISSLNSTFLRDAAQARGVPVECVISKGAGHGFGGEGIDPTVAEINRRTVEFFLQHLTPP